MEIAFLTRYFPKLSESFIINQVTGLLDLGHEVTVFADSPPNEELQHETVEEYNLRERTVYTGNPELYSEGIETSLDAFSEIALNHPEHLSEALRTIKYGQSAPRMLSNMAAFLSHSEQFDIFHAHFGPVGKNWSFLPRIQEDGAFITTFYGMDVTGFVHPNNYDFYDDFWDRCDLSIGISQHIRTKMIVLGCEEGNSIRHPIGVDTDKFNNSDVHYTEEDTFRLVTVARHAEQKGLKYAIEAVSECIDDGKEIEYRIAGDGELRPNLESLIEDNGVENDIELLGWLTQSEIQSLLDWGHAFLLPSVTASDGSMEGQALVLQEAQAMGLPVISTYHNGIPEGVREQETGLLVPERDVTAIAESIHELYDDPDRVGQFSRSARAYVESDFDNETLMDKQLSIYQSVLRTD